MIGGERPLRKRSYNVVEFAGWSGGSRMEWKEDLKNNFFKCKLGSPSLPHLSSLVKVKM